MTRDEWLARFADAAGVPAPTQADVDTLLSVAGVAAHASERTAAPVTCWIASVAGLSPDAALTLARSLVPPDDSAP